MIVTSRCSFMENSSSRGVMRMSSTSSISHQPFARRCIWMSLPVRQASHSLRSWSGERAVNRVKTEENQSHAGELINGPFELRSHANASEADQTTENEPPGSRAQENAKGHVCGRGIVRRFRPEAKAHKSGDECNDGGWIR